MSGPEDFVRCKFHCPCAPTSIWWITTPSERNSTQVDVGEANVDDEGLHAQVRSTAVVQMASVSALRSKVEARPPGWGETPSAAESRENVFSAAMLEPKAMPSADPGWREGRLDRRGILKKAVMAVKHLIRHHESLEELGCVFIAPNAASLPMTAMGGPQRAITTGSAFNVSAQIVATGGDFSDSTPSGRECPQGVD